MEVLLSVFTFYIMVASLVSNHADRGKVVSRGKLDSRTVGPHLPKSSKSLV